MTPTLHTIRDCLEGAVPAVIATCDPQGVPNVSYVSEVHYVDASHVALSYQFFSKTRQNVLCNPRATVLVIHPHSGAQYRLVLRYLRTEQSGPLFESMKAKLAGIASHTGMSGVFALRGSDVYHVERIDEACGPTLPVPARETNLLAQLRLGVARLAAAGDLNALVDELLATLREKLAITHGMVLLRDAATGKLFTVASFGYRQSGVGAEIAPGQGVIGVAAQEGTPIRLSHATSEFGYGRAVRRSATGQGLALGPEQEIPFPGLPESRSQLAVPVKGIAGLIGVLFVESTEDGRFGYDDEDALMLLASLAGMAYDRLARSDADEDAMESPARATPVSSGPPLRIRHYSENDSIFCGDEYLIKGVAGAILWKLVRAYVDEGRSEHTNRELRLDSSLRLPELSENLEARLILLQRRLRERCPGLQIEKTGRGRFRLVVGQPLSLAEAGGVDPANAGPGRAARRSPN
jgi:adenylate cyclase